MEYRAAEESTREDDWLWLARAAEGDQIAFARLVERHQDRVVGLCQRLLGNREGALDAAQEVFLRLYRKAAALERRGQLYTWLYRVATNYCLNRLRRRKIVRFLPFETSAPEGSDVRDWQPVDLGPGPERELADRQRWQRTRSAIAALPPNQRAVLILARFEGLAYREIAQILEITEGAVESRLFRAMRNLQKAQEGGT